QVQAEGLDEGALPRTGHTRHAHPDRTTRLRQDLLEEPLRLRLIVGARALDQRDRLGERSPIAASQVGRQLLDLYHASVWRPVATIAVPPPAKPARQTPGWPSPERSPPATGSYAAAASPLAARRSHCSRRRTLALRPTRDEVSGRQLDQFEHATRRLRHVRPGSEDRLDAPLFERPVCLRRGRAPHLLPRLL